MSQELSPMRPLSVGNVVTTGLVIYRSHLKSYFNLALIAYLWILLPIYGWAKYSAINGLIARLAFAELINKPESVDTARSQVNPHLWSFLGVGIGVGLRLLGIYVLMYIAAALAVGIPIAVLGQSTGIFVGVIAALVVVVVGIIMVIRFYSRWFVAEIPLAVEEGVTGAGHSIDRSWELTQNAVGRIQYIIVVAFLVTVPIQILTGYIPSIFQIGVEANSTAYQLLGLISFALSLLGGALVMPFWQIIKAVIYYDLRTRREGLDLQLRDRSNNW